MSGGNNGPVIVNGGSNTYNRDVCTDAPVAFDTGIYVYPTKTLAQLRTDLAALMGWAAMATLPGAISSYLTLVLQLAQSQQYYRYNCLRTERWFGWQLSPGKRFYDVPVDCTKALNFRKITACWLADNGGIAVDPYALNTAYALGTYVHALGESELIFEVTTAGTSDAAVSPTWPTEEGGTVVNGTVTFTARRQLQAQWLPMTQGIDPSCFGNTDRSHPTHFELRESLELWPAPDQPYVLWLKGHIGLRRFTEDEDECTIDHEIVLLFATAMAKSKYRQPDADIYAQMCTRMASELTAASHGLRRYVVTPDNSGMKPEYRGSDMRMPRATWRD